MIRKVAIEREVNGEKLSFSLTLNEIQRVYDAMLWATVSEEVEMRMEADDGLAVLKPYKDEVVERLLWSLQTDVTDDIISDEFEEVCGEIKFEHDLED